MSISMIQSNCTCRAGLGPTVGLIWHRGGGRETSALNPRRGTSDDAPENPEMTVLERSHHIEKEKHGFENIGRKDFLKLCQSKRP